VPPGLSAEQASREATLRELGEAMVAIEAAAARVRRAIEALQGRAEADPNIVAALTRSASELDATRRRLHQDGYLSQPQVPLFLPEVDEQSGPLSLFPVEPAGE
jgi:multidrug efflux pump subunit AcrA (membrane-fusion protein)